LFRRGDLADGGAGLVAEAAGELELAEVPFLEPGEGLRPRGLGAALEAVLDDLPVFRLRFGEHAAFPDVVGDGLFHVDVLAVRRGGDGDQAVGVIRRGDADGIDVLRFTQFPIVAVGRDLGSSLLDLGLGAGQHLRVAIAEGDEAGAFRAEHGIDMGHAAAVEADDSDAQLVVRALRAGQRGKQ
jgi:hypothetical protein